MTASVLLVKALGGGWTVSSLPSDDALTGKAAAAGTHRIHTHRTPADRD